MPLLYLISCQLVSSITNGQKEEKENYLIHLAPVFGQMEEKDKLDQFL